MKHELSELYETIQIKEAAKSLKKIDVKATEKKMEKEVTDIIGGNEIQFINNFLSKGQKVDEKVVKSIDSLIKKYKAKIGQSKIKTDANLMMLAPIIASMYSELSK